MFTIRTLTAVGLALVLSAGAHGAGKKGPPGRHSKMPSVQGPKLKNTIAGRSGPRGVIQEYDVCPGWDGLKAAPGSRSRLSNNSWGGGASPTVAVSGSRSRLTANGSMGPGVYPQLKVNSKSRSRLSATNSTIRPPMGPRQVTNQEIIDALNNGTQLKRRY